MRQRKLSKHIALITAALLLHGCGGSSNSSDEVEIIDPPTLTGVFLDSPVANIDYKTFDGDVETRSGVTDIDGKYDYEAGETVVFSIGALEFPPVAAAATVTPLDIADTDDPNDTEAVNMIRLLQTLDKDGDPSNGIEITDTAKAVASPIDSFNVSDEDFSASVQTLITSGGQDDEPTELVSAAEAVAHFEDTLADSGVTFNTLTGSWQLTGEEAVIFHFLPDGRYLAMQWEEVNGSEGFEYGTYTATDGSITFVTRENNDGYALTCDEDRGVLCDGSNGIEPGVWGYSFSDEGQLVFSVPEDGDFGFDKLEATDSPIDGLWENRDAKNLLFFTKGSATSAGYFFYVDYGSEGDDYDTNLDVGTYTTLVNEGKTEIKVISEKQYNRFGLDCEVLEEGDNCDVYEPGYEVVNNQLAISNEAEDEDSARRNYLDRVFANDNAPANTAKLVAQKHYASDIAANEGYGIEIEDDYRTRLLTDDVDTEAPSSFKATFKIDESATSLQRGVDSSAGLETRMYAYYQFPNNEDLSLSVSLRLRYYGEEVTARFILASELVTEVEVIETVTLDTDFTGNHTMEMAWDSDSSSFDFSIDGVEVGSTPLASFTSNEEVVAAGGYTFNPALFQSVRFRVEAYNVTKVDDSGLITVHLDEFSTSGGVYDDFTGGLIDSDKWYYQSEER
ncbi:hypothetical protein [Leucothrix arctica]|uniref:Uncharacterized protein n=1 Tax=Leucothrix arctica TaxID=1481894 RepID=A0A317C6W8_9GAMM|nr:hypothetical protein [Leucothrix arctica]PWQ93961.1 hypothetical protein DKT75_20405 [Leucothrix arctica]